MRRAWIIVPLIVAVAPLGCRKSASAPPQATPYDRDIDGPPSYLTVGTNDALLKDQAQVAQEYGAAAAGGGGAAAPAPTDPVTAVRRQVASLISAVKAGNADTVAAAFVAADATTLRDGLRAMQSVAAKARALQSLIQTKLNVSPPEDIQDIGGVDLSGLFGADFAGADPAAMQIAAKNGQMVVTRPNAPPMVFVQEGGRWKVLLDPVQKQLAGLFGEEGAAAEKAIDEISAGVSAGTITQANLTSKAEEIRMQHLDPVEAKMKPLRDQIMAEVLMPTGPETPATAPAPPNTGL